MEAKTALKRGAFLKEARSFLIVTVGMLIYSFSWTIILAPAQVMGGGMAGLGMLVYYLTGGESGGIPIGYTYFVSNAILLLIGTLLIGPKFGAKTIYAIVVNSVALTLMQRFIPAELMGLSQDKLLSAILGGGLTGLGIGICFSQGGSTGGTDIIAMVVNKYRHISLGKVIIFCDMITIGFSYFVFKDIQSIIYGYVTLGVNGYTIDLFLQGRQSSSQLMVFSCKYREIADRVTRELHRGVTVVDALGWYTQKPQKMLVIMCRRMETSAIYRIIKECDSRAFISSTSVNGVYGEGFEQLKVKNVPAAGDKSNPT